MTAAPQPGLPGLEPAPIPSTAPTDEAPPVGRAFVHGYLARYRGRPDTDVPYRAEAARAAYMAGWRACARVLTGGFTTTRTAGDPGEKES